MGSGYLPKALIAKDHSLYARRVDAVVAGSAGSRGVEVLCFRRLPLAIWRCALVATLLATNAVAQNGVELDRLLLQPSLDGGARNQPRLRQPNIISQNDSGLPSGEAPVSPSQPASGAGATGFDSTNTRKRKAKSTPKSKQDSAARTPAGQPPVGQPVVGQPVALLALPPADASRQNPVQRPVLAISYPAGAFAGTPTNIPAALQLRKLGQDDDPFAPTGVQIGAFNLRPAVEVTGAYDTNAPRASLPTPSAMSLFSPELLVNSNWARHELTANLRGTLTSYEETKDLNRPDFDGKVNGRIDVATDTRADFEARFLLGTENPGSPNIQANVVRIPIFTTLGGTAGVTQRFNRFDVTAKVGVERTLYQDSHFTDGSTSSNESRDYNRYSTALRLAYELSPGLKPFAEVAVDARHHDLPVDFTGVSRDSKGISGKVGSTFEYSRILIGEASIGYLARDYKDPTLQSIGGFLVDGSLTWLMSALTTVKLTAATSVAESTVTGVSGVFTRTVGAQVDHAFRRWLIATAKFGLGMDDYVGSSRRDMRYTVSTQLTYKLSQEFWVRAEYRHLWLNSTQSGSNYAADVFLLGVRLQR